MLKRTGFQSTLEGQSGFVGTFCCHPQDHGVPGGVTVGRWSTKPVISRAKVATHYKGGTFLHHTGSPGNFRTKWA